jgi:dihydroorotate dehydrogenase electron transfer subunit
MIRDKAAYLSEQVYENIEISKGIYKLTIKGSFTGIPGQFYMLRAWQQEPLLSRPISIHYADDEKIEFLYAVVGEGTDILSKLKSNDEINITGPLGNGFDLDLNNKRVAVITGGIGIAPMIFAAKRIKNAAVDFYAGFRNEVYGLDGLQEVVKNVYVTTETGKHGHKGYITEIFSPLEYDVVLCCGPEIMMRWVIEMCREVNVPVYVSMENKMACGVGACLVCTCKTKSGNKRSCKDGPVFLGEQIL